MNANYTILSKKINFIYLPTCNLRLATCDLLSMGDVYRQYFQKWFELGGGTFAHFSDVGTPSKFGSWGALEDVSQSSSPKYDALMAII